MFRPIGAFDLLVETRVLFSRAAIGFGTFLIVYKFLLLQLFRFLNIDTILVMGVIYLLLRLSLKGGEWRQDGKYFPQRVKNVV